MRALAEANTNIALVKYWGKNDPELNLPAVPSLSLTLAGLTTRTEVHFDVALTADVLWLNGAVATGVPLQRVSRQLDRVARALGVSVRSRAMVQSSNNFPTAAGLASSASAFAALTLSASAALGGAEGAHLECARLSVLARQGSGSAARSVYGGLVVLGVGTPGQEYSSAASELLPPTGWPELRLVIGVVSEREKDTPSTDGMTHTSATSPYFAPFVASAPAELLAAVQAVRARDLERLGQVAERSALRMHASALAADPGVVYLRGPTIEGLHTLRGLRQRGVAAFFTCDAGPHPKALTLASDADTVAAALGAVPGVQRTIVARPGEGARLLPMEAASALA